MKNLTPFKIDVPQYVLDDLANRLSQTRWTVEPKDTGWNYGVNPTYLNTSYVFVKQRLNRNRWLLIFPGNNFFGVKN